MKSCTLGIWPLGLDLYIISFVQPFFYYFLQPGQIVFYWENIFLAYIKKYNTNTTHTTYSNYNTRGS